MLYVIIRTHKNLNRATSSKQARIIFLDANFYQGYHSLENLWLQLFMQLFALHQNHSYLWVFWNLQFSSTEMAAKPLGLYGTPKRGGCWDWARWRREGVWTYHMWCSYCLLCTQVTSKKHLNTILKSVKIPKSTYVSSLKLRPRIALRWYFVPESLNLSSLPHSLSPFSHI